MIYFYIIFSAAFLILLSAVYAGWRAAPWVPTSRIDVGRIIKLAEIQPGQKFYDLGSGDGRIICAAAREGATAEGIEISILPYCLSRIRSLFRGKSKITFGDFWWKDLSDANIIYFFLMPKVYPKLKSKFKNELKSGTKIIARTWPFKDWEPLAVDVSEGCSALYLYQTPLDKN